MRTVFLALEHDYEGDTVLGAFKRREDAERCEAANREKGGRAGSVSEVPVQGAPAPDLAAKFAALDAKNPAIYDAFVIFARDALAVRKPDEFLNAGNIVRRIRHETRLREEGAKFKISQNYAPYLARKFMTEYPEYNGVFSTRRTREQL